MKIKNIVLSLVICTASAQIFSDEQVVENNVEQAVQPLVKKHVIADATTETTEANAEEAQASDVVAQEEVATEEVVAAEEVAQN